MENFVWVYDYEKNDKCIDEYEPEDWWSSVEAAIRSYSAKLNPAPQVVDPLAVEHFLILLKDFETLAYEEVGKLKGEIDCERGVAEVTAELPQFKFDRYLDSRYFIMEVITYTKDTLFTVENGYVKIVMTIKYFMDMLSEEDEQARIEKNKEKDQQIHDFIFGLSGWVN